MAIPVLIYHGFHACADELASTPAFERRYSLPVERLREHLQWMADNGIAGRSLAESAHPDGSVALTFDDGHRSGCTHVLPALAARGFRATFFVVAGWIGRKGYLTRGELLELRSAGMEIGSHGLTHALLASIPLAKTDAELRQSKEILEQLLGAPVGRFAAPGGSVTNAILRRAFEAGYAAVCTSRPGRYRGGRVVPRLSITSHTSFSAFQALARGGGAAVALAGSGWLLRRAVKGVSGVAGYEWMLQRFASLRHRTSCP